MKSLRHLLVFLGAILGLTFAEHCFRMADVADVPDILPTEDTLEDDALHGRYVDFNDAFSPASSCSVSPMRNPGQSGAARQPSGKRILSFSEYTFTVARHGKLCGLPSVASFLSTMSLYPSGLFSEKHDFIRFRKLTI